MADLITRTRPPLIQMVVEQSNIDHIMRGLQSTEGVRLHNHRKKLRQRFDIIKKLGQGTYGKVQLGINKETGQEVAIKAVKKCKIKTEADLVRIRREIQIMSSVRHPNIIHIYEVFENREKMVLVMEYAAGGELYDFLSERKVLEEVEARRIFRQISTAVYYCHKHKICHRDLKLENILLDEHGNAKIADFGLSNVYDEQNLLNSFCGSPLYASPEIVKGTPYHGPEVDCWSLGVLLYTLVYGAMPFDGSNFKRLVKQISQGVYFEPKTPSPASPLIREMLTVNPQKRATIEQICSHAWVNQGFNVSCLDIAEDLANQTPVRLDLLLSLVPPPENSEKLVVTDDQSTASQDTPARSLSVGSFMELDPNTEQIIREFVAQEVPFDNAEKTVKRKLEPDGSESSIRKEAARKKERTKQSEDLRETEIPNDVKSAEKVENNNVVMDVDTNANKILAKDEVTSTNVTAKAEEPQTSEETENLPTEIKPESPNDTAKAEKVAESISKDKPTRKSVKVVKKKLVKEGEAEKKENDEAADSKVKIKKKKKEDVPTGDDTSPKKNEPDLVTDAKDKEDVQKEVRRESTAVKSPATVKSTTKEDGEKSQPTTPSEDIPSSKLTERRKSKIFEQAEKFMSNDPKSPSPEKPKKVFIPGVKVSDFAKAFERRSSVTNTPSVRSSPTRKSISKESTERKSEDRTKESPEKKNENSSQGGTVQTDAKVTGETSAPTLPREQTPTEKEPEGEERKPTAITDEKLKKLKDSARNIISNALVEEERKKVKKQVLKPPVPRMKSEDSEVKKPLTLQIGKETATVQIHSPENIKYSFEPPVGGSGENKENIEAPKEKKTAKVEITLRSNTLPRGASSKAELQMKTPPAQGMEKTGNFRTEVEHRVGDPHALFSTQRSEVSFPVSAAQRPVRSMSLEPELRKAPPQMKERIIPIHLEDGSNKEENEARDRVRDLQGPTEGRTRMPYQRTQSLRSTSLSRQSTQDSDTESAPVAPGDAIKKSPREFIIPIAVEGGGYVTPRATSLEPSENLAKRGMRPFPKKMSSLWSDNGSEDESTFPTLQRHPSRDMDEPFRLHRLRSSRPTRSSVERADSASGSEEEEDDDGFEILTAENLFSTLLSRVRSLTQRLNVEGGVRPGFPSSRLMNHFGPTERLFSNFHQPLHTRLSDRPDFRRSFSRDIENGFNRRGRDDLSNSDSTRSAARDSKSRRCDSDSESVSECSYGSQRRKTKEQGDKVLKKSTSHSRNKTYLKNKEDGEDFSDSLTKTPPTHGSRTLPLPVSRGLGARSYQRQISDSQVMDSGHHDFATLYRTLSMKADGKEERSDRKSIAIGEELPNYESKVKDFYDILAEKYGITSVKRYDLPESEGWRTKRQNTKPVACESEILDGKSAEEFSQKTLLNKQPEIRPPVPRTVKNEDAERFKSPSEKLAAVLNRLEGGSRGKAPERQAKLTTVQSVDSSSKKSEESNAIDKGNVGTHTQTSDHKEVSSSSDQKQESSPDKTASCGTSENTMKSGIPKRITTRHNSDMSVKEFDKHRGGKSRKSETPERSILGKFLQGVDRNDAQKSGNEFKNSEDYFRETKLKHYGSLRSRLSEEGKGNGKKERMEREGSVARRKSLKESDSPEKKKESNEDTKMQQRIKRLSKDLEAELLKEDELAWKSKLATSLEKKFEKMRTDKKYVDKAIRSLRESSLGPKDESSENALIKRAVSLSDCSSGKAQHSGRVQGTVNSVLGMFKKIDNSDTKKDGNPDSDTVPKAESKIPMPKLTVDSVKRRPSLRIDLPDGDKAKGKPETRRQSYGSFLYRNDLSLNRSPSSLLGLDDSSSLKSPDSESFDSWSNCSDLGSPDDFYYRTLPRHATSIFDEMSTESVSDRIRRKSFYTRFNERKKPRRSSILDPRKKYEQEDLLSYPRPTDKKDENNESTNKSPDDIRPRTFYKSGTDATRPIRKTSFDWPRTASSSTLARSFGCSSPLSGYATLSRSYVDSLDESRSGRISALERSLSPVSALSSARARSPSLQRSPNLNS